MNAMTSFDVEGEKQPRALGSSRPIDVSVEDEREFFLAVAEYKERSGRLFPTCSELLEVLKSLGYAKRIWKPVSTWSPIPGPAWDGVADGRESPGLVGWFSSVETPTSLH